MSWRIFFFYGVLVYTATDTPFSAAPVILPSSRAGTHVGVELSSPATRKRKTPTPDPFYLFLTRSNLGKRRRAGVAGPLPSDVTMADHTDGRWASHSRTRARRSDDGPRTRVAESRESRRSKHSKNTQDEDKKRERVSAREELAVGTRLHLSARGGHVGSGSSSQDCSSSMLQPALKLSVQC